MKYKELRIMQRLNKCVSMIMPSEVGLGLVIDHLSSVDLVA